MTANICPRTGIAYGYISANALNYDVVDTLLYGSCVAGSSDDDVAQEARLELARELGREPEDWEAEQAIEAALDGVCEREAWGVLDGVHYRASWLGGALNFWAFDSPHVTDSARMASPCVPNAGILDTLDGSVTAYDVPAHWRRSD